MPDPALPVPPGDFTGLIKVDREYNDAAGRPMNGVATATRVDPPRTSVMADVIDGKVSFLLTPGKYTLAAMLRTSDRSRVYMAEDLTVTQEDS